MQPDGKTLGLWVAGHNAYGTCVIVANMIILFRFSNYTGWGEWTVTGMILAFYTILYVESLFSFLPQVFYIFDTMMEQMQIWFQMIGITALIIAMEQAYHKITDEFKSKNSSSSSNNDIEMRESLPNP